MQQFCFSSSTGRLFSQSDECGDRVTGATLAVSFMRNSCDIGQEAFKQKSIGRAIESPVLFVLLLLHSGHTTCPLAAFWPH